MNVDIHLNFFSLKSVKTTITIVMDCVGIDLIKQSGV